MINPHFDMDAASKMTDEEVKAIFDAIEDVEMSIAAAGPVEWVCFGGAYYVLNSEDNGYDPCAGADDLARRLRERRKGR